MKHCTYLLILSVTVLTLGCQQSYMTKKENEIISYISEKKGILHRAAQEEERINFPDIFKKPVFTKYALSNDIIISIDHPSQNFQQINVPIRNIYQIRTPAIDSFLTGSLVAASSTLIIYHGLYKNKYFPISNF